MTTAEKRIISSLLTEVERCKNEPRYRAAALAEYHTFLTTCLLAQTLAGKTPKGIQIQIQLSPPAAQP